MILSSREKNQSLYMEKLSKFHEASCQASDHSWTTSSWEIKNIMLLHNRLSTKAKNMSTISRWSDHFFGIESDKHQPIVRANRDSKFFVVPHDTAQVDYEFHYKNTMNKLFPKLQDIPIHKEPVKHVSK